MNQEILQKLELFRRKIQRMPLARNLATAQIHFDLAEGIFFFRLRSSFGTSEDSLHPRQQLTNRKRLGDVVVRTQFESDHLVYFLSAGSQHDDRNRRPLRLKL